MCWNVVVEEWGIVVGGEMVEIELCRLNSYVVVFEVLVVIFGFGDSCSFVRLVVRCLWSWLVGRLVWSCFGMGFVLVFDLGC